MIQIKINPLGLLTMSLVTVSAAEYECPRGTSGKYLVQYSDSKKCFNSLDDALKDIQKGEKAEVIALTDISGYATAEAFTKDVTLNLNEHTLSFGTSGSFTTKGAHLTITNGTIDASTNTEILKVDATDKKAALTIEKNVEVTSTAVGTGVIGVTSAKNKAEINIYGTWNISNELVNCEGEKDNLTINLYATVTHKGAKTAALLSLDAGSTVVNVRDGSYTTSQNVFIVENGTLNIMAGTVKSTGKSAIYVKEPNTDDKLTNALNITGGKVISESKTQEAIWFSGSKGTYKINGGEVTSGEDEKENQLPALRIANKDFLKNHPGMITKGTFTGSIVGQTQNEDGRYVEADEAAKILVENATDNYPFFYLAYLQCH